MENLREDPDSDLPESDLNYIFSLVGDILDTRFSHKETYAYMFPLENYNIGLQIEKRSFTTLLSFGLVTKSKLRSQTVSTFLYKTWVEYLNLEDLEEVLPTQLKYFKKMLDHVYSHLDKVIDLDNFIHSLKDGIVGLDLKDSHCYIFDKDYRIQINKIPEGFAYNGNNYSWDEIGILKDAIKYQFDKDSNARTS